MALGLQTESGGGEYAQIIKYDARAGRMFRIDRSQDAGGSWQTSNVEISNGFQAVFDLENILVGWALFAAGVAPAFSMVPLGQALPAKPADQYKQGFKLMVKLGKDSGGDVRELSSCAKVVIAALDALHTQYEAGKAANPGKLPVVALTGTTPVTTQGKGQSSTNYQPVFSIVKWVARPDDLTAIKAPAPVAANQGVAQPVAQARTTSQVAPAPAEDDEEF